MKKVLCVLISILLIVFSVPMTAFAEQEATYKTIPVEYSDNRKETEHLDVMIKNNNVFVNAEQLANRFSYDIEIDENKVSIKSLENPALPGVYVVFYFDDTKVTKMLYSDFCTKFEAPFASEKNEKGVWIPFEYSVLILNSGITILDDCVLIDIPEKTILDYFFDVQINSSRFNFDWAKDFGLDKVNVDIMGVSSHWTNMLNGVLAFDYLSWVQLFQTTNTLGMFTTAYDGKYGEKIATLICTQSDEEVKAVVNQIDEINDVFSDDGHLGNALKNYSKELDASTGSIYNSCNKLLEDIKSGNSSTAKYNKTYRELEKALDKQTWFSNSGERIVDVQKGLSKATAVLDIISYIADYLNCINEFQNQDDFSVSSLKSEIGDNHLYGNLLLHDMKASMKFYANQLSTDVGTYSAVQFIENNATKLFEKGTKVTAALGSKANYMLFAWNLASNFVPFFSEGLKATDNFELAMYSQIFQTDAYINYQNFKNHIFLNNDNLTSEDLYKVSQYCYIYLKSCYVTRNAALGSILPDKKEKMSTIIDTQNETNKEIAEIMAHIKNADIENTNKVYGFLLSNNKDYLASYNDEHVKEFIEINGTNIDKSIFNSGDFIIKAGKGFVCSDGKKAYYKESITDKGIQLSDMNYCNNIMSNGEIVFFSGHNNSLAEVDDPRTIFSVNIDGTQIRKLFESNGSVHFVTCFSDCIYYIDYEDYAENNLWKYDIKDDRIENIGASFIKKNYYIKDAKALGSNIYIELQNNNFTESEVIMYNPLNKQTTKVATVNSNTDAFCYNDNEVIIMDIYESNVLDSYKNKHLIYIVDKSGNIEKTSELPENMDIQIVSPNASFAICSNSVDANDHNLYNVDLNNGESTIIDNSYDMFKGNTYRAVRDLVFPEMLYFVTDMPYFFHSANNTLLKKTCVRMNNNDYFYGIVDGYIVDNSLNTYKIFDEDTTSNQEMTITKKTS